MARHAGVRQVAELFLLMCIQCIFQKVCTARNSVPTWQIEACPSHQQWMACTSIVCVNRIVPCSDVMERALHPCGSGNEAGCHVPICPWLAYLNALSITSEQGYNRYQNIPWVRAWRETIFSNNRRKLALGLWLFQRQSLLKEFHTIK